MSKGRPNSSTARYFEKDNTDYTIVVEPQDVREYEKIIDNKKILILPFSNLNQGAAPARNYIRQHSERNGHAKHWVFDDNIRRCLSYNKGIFSVVNYIQGINHIESIADKYQNVGLAAFNYKMFVTRNTTKPLAINKRVYSAILFNNELPFEWRLPYNSDVDLSLQVLSSGEWCTLLFNTFVVEKQQTMKSKGGNTERYAGKGRYIMSKTIESIWPQYIRSSIRYNRVQHQFTKEYHEINNRLILK